jgi:hypothetical protein
MMQQQLLMQLMQNQSGINNVYRNNNYPQSLTSVISPGSQPFTPGNAHQNMFKEGDSPKLNYPGSNKKPVVEESGIPYLSTNDQTKTGNSNFQRYIASNANQNIQEMLGSPQKGPEFAR